MTGKKRYWGLGLAMVGLAGGVSACGAEAPDTGACAHFAGGYEGQQEGPAAARAHARESLWKSYRDGVPGCTVLRVTARDGDVHEWIVRFTRVERGGLSVLLTVRDTTIDRKEGRRITAIAEFEPAAVVRLRRDGDGAELSRDAVAEGDSFVLKFVDGAGQVIRNQGI